MYERTSDCCGASLLDGMNLQTAEGALPTPHHTTNLVHPKEDTGPDKSPPSRRARLDALRLQGLRAIFHGTRRLQMLRTNEYENGANHLPARQP